jgi:glutaredoxin 3
MSEITVYTAEPSEICARVKRLLDARGLSYTEIDVQSDGDRTALFEATGRKGCPVVVIGDEVLGGCRETVRPTSPDDSPNSQRARAGGCGLSQAVAEPAQERDWRGGVAGCAEGVAAGGGGGGVPEAVAVGGSAQVGEVLLGDEVELGMHG